MRVGMDGGVESKSFSIESQLLSYPTDVVASISIPYSLKITGPSTSVGWIWYFTPFQRI